MAPTTSASGGTSLLTNTFTQNTDGTLATATGFLDSATYTGDGLSHVQRSPSEVLMRVGEIISNDRAFNKD